MITEKELQNLAKVYLALEKEEEKMNEIDDRLWKDKDRIEKVLEKELRKKVKIPKSVSMKIGNYKITQTVSWGWLKVKKVKK